MFKDVRDTKSRSMMMSLYVLSGLATLTFSTFVIFLLEHILTRMSFVTFTGPLSDLLLSVIYVVSGVTLSLPFAAAICFSLIYGNPQKPRTLPGLAVRLSERVPVILFGLLFLVCFGAGPAALVGSMTFLSITLLIRRWSTLLGRVSEGEIEAMKSLGLSMGDIFYLLFVRRFSVQCLFHVLSVVCFLTVLVTPFLCFSFSDMKLPATLGTELFREIGENPEVSAGLAALVLVLHGLRAWLDYRTSFWEVDFG